MTHDKISLRNWINEKCDYFEDLWLSDTPPNFCSFLAAVEGSEYQQALLIPLLELEAFYQKKKGQQLDDRTIRDTFPQFTSQLDTFFQPSVKGGDAELIAAADTQTSQARHTTFAGIKQSKEVTVPEHFGRYRIIKTLGTGGMGVVYLAEDTELNREVALKIPKFPEGQNEIEDRFRREAKAAARLQHRNICPVFDIATHDGQLFITMAYIKGRPLAEFIRPEKLPSASAVAKTIRKLALALQEAHDQEIVHRDLKPANIMIDHKQEPVVMDFGLARYQLANERQLTTSGMIIGTPTYMSPEQVRDSGNAGPPADVYSLGVIMYQMLTGKVPFTGDMMSVITSIVLDEPESPSSIRKRVDQKLEQICMKALQKKPEDRFDSMTEFANQLTRFLRERPSAIESNTTAPNESLLESSKAVAAKTEHSKDLADEQQTSNGKRLIWTVATAAACLGVAALAAMVIPSGEPERPSNDEQAVAASDASTEAVDTKLESDKRTPDASLDSELPTEPALIIDNLIERGAIFIAGSDDTPLSVGQWRDLRQTVRSASLSQPKLSQESMVAVASMFPNLASVEIQLGTSPPEAIEALSNFNHDTFTLICNSGNEIISTSQVQAISKIKSLFRLHLQSCMLEDSHMQTIAELPNLVCLDLRDNRISALGLEHLKQAPMLYELWLGDPFAPSDEFFKAIGSFPKIDRLTVNLRNNSDLKEVCQRPLKSIVFLNANYIDDLRPLVGLPLEGIETDMDLGRHKELLLKIPTLETINGMSREDFFAKN